jgi:hypothetical protein
MSRYAVSDLHGMLGLYQEIKKFIKKGDVVYCLGDCGDRGPQPWETLKAVVANPQFVLLKGNHEAMLADAMKEVSQTCNELDLYAPKANLLIQNGGFDTLDGWIDDGADLSWISYLNNLPTHLELENEQGIKILLSHAGYTPGKELSEDKDLIWGRVHFYNVWPEGHKLELVIHGHTPNQLLWKDLQRAYGKAEPWENGAYWYADGHKVCLDCGSFQSKQTVLFDLDTFDEHIFSI